MNWRMFQIANKVECKETHKTLRNRKNFWFFSHFLFAQKCERKMKKKFMFVYVLFHCQKNDNWNFCTFELVKKKLYKLLNYFLSLQWGEQVVKAQKCLGKSRQNAVHKWNVLLVFCNWMFHSTFCAEIAAIFETTWVHGKHNGAVYSLVS